MSERIMEPPQGIDTRNRRLGFALPTDDVLDCRRAHAQQSRHGTLGVVMVFVGCNKGTAHVMDIESHASSIIQILW